MDDYMFREHVVGSKVVRENTSYLEILNYSVRIRASFQLLPAYIPMYVSSPARKRAEGKAGSIAGNSG